MYAPVNFHKKVLSSKIESGKILLGEEIIETPHIKYKVNNETQAIVEQMIS